MKSYDYAHRSGVRPLSWEDFAGLAARLAEQLAVYQPQAIVGVARAGLFPATAVACSLRRELFPARLTRPERRGGVPHTGVENTGLTRSGRQGGGGGG
jgi:adenine/guanine phosphoribosyltransferase-like PRPP-binding protein